MSTVNINKRVNKMLHTHSDIKAYFDKHGARATINKLAEDRDCDQKPLAENIRKISFLCGDADVSAMKIEDIPGQIRCFVFLKEGGSIENMLIHEPVGVIYDDEYLLAL